MEELNLEDFPEVDFTNALRGRRPIELRPGLRVSIDEEVARHYRDDDAVNNALRMLIAEGAPVENDGAEPRGNIARVSLDEDVAAHYRADAQVNGALHRLISQGRAPQARRD